MPLLKKAQQPQAAPAAAVSPAADHLKTDTAKKLQPDSLDAKSRQIQRQGAFQAALRSVGVVQHGGKTFDDYLARVRQAADAELGYINE